MPIQLPKISIPTKQRATKEIEQVEGGLLLNGVFLVVLLGIRLALPDADADDKS